jgi:proteasome lid subunit RPN8/RPN11
VTRHSRRRSVCSVDQRASGPQGREYFLPRQEATRLRRLAAAAQRNGHREICGIVACGPDRVLSVMLVPNESSLPGHWEIPVSVVRELRRLLHRSQLNVVGTFHSHPISPSVPGSSDLRRATLGSLLLIYDVCGREMKLWRVDRKGRGSRAAEVDIVQGGEDAVAVRRHRRGHTATMLGRA